ncbi:MAG: O-antigen/teichoic acid export membrane protein [Parvicellaceae bacterium]|jgi:O-antigen/teichoic acid export membrane protein
MVTSERNTKLKKSIIGLLGVKIFNFTISFIMFPLSLSYLGNEKNGIWLTVGAFVSWFSLFDFGLGNGFRNKFVESTASGDLEKARSLVSTTYAILSLISLVILILFVTANFFITWDTVFDPKNKVAEDLSALMLVVFSFFCLQFVVQIIKVILIADQRPQIAGYMNSAANFLALIGIGILYLLKSENETGSLLTVGITISAANLIVPLVCSFFFFAGKYKQYAPSLKHVDFSSYGSTMGLGLQFFVMQIAGLVVVTTDNMIITQTTGASDVTIYQGAYKFFGAGMILFNVIVTPYWSAFTEAYISKDFNWIRKITKKTQLLWFLLICGVILMLVISPWVYGWWIPSIEIPFQLSIMMAIWVIINTGLLVYSNFLSGSGKIRLSLYHSVVAMIINIPLSYIFAVPLAMGSTGVMLATCICISLRFFQPIQYYLLINSKAKGIWNR